MLWSLRDRETANHCISPLRSDLPAAELEHIFVFKRHFSSQIKIVQNWHLFLPKKLFPLFIIKCLHSVYVLALRHARSEKMQIVRAFNLLEYYFLIVFSIFNVEHYHGMEMKEYKV